MEEDGKKTNKPSVWLFSGASYDTKQASIGMEFPVKILYLLH